MTHRLLLTTALSGLAVIGLTPAAYAKVTETTTTTYTYDFPDSTPTTSQKVSTVSNCYTRSGGGGGGGEGGAGGYRDTNGDGLGDTRDRNASVGSPGVSSGYGTPTAGTSQYGGIGTGNVSKTGTYSGNGWGTTSSGSSGGGSTRVICTYFYQKGELDADTYYADMEFTRQHLKGATVRGYHFWAIPYARAMRQNPGGMLEKIIRPVTIHRARELAHQMGVPGSRPDYLGKFFRLTIEPVCTLIGQFVSEGQWQKLYSPDEIKNYALDYQVYVASKSLKLNEPSYLLKQLIAQIISKNIYRPLNV